MDVLAALFVSGIALFASCDSLDVLLGCVRLRRGEETSPSSNFLGLFIVLLESEESLDESSELAVESLADCASGNTCIWTCGVKSCPSDDESDTEARGDVGLSVLIIRSLLGIDLSSVELSTYFPKMKEIYARHPSSKTAPRILESTFIH